MLNRLVIVLVLGVFLMMSQGCQTRSVSEEEKAARIEAAKRLAHEAALRRSGELNRIMESERRAWDTVAPLMEEAADYRANETFGYIGAVFVSELFYPDFLNQEVDRIGYGDFVSIRFVFAGSPAEKVGLEVGDKILSVNGRKVPKGNGAAIFALRKMKRLLVPGESNQIEVERDGEQLIFEVVAESAAYYGLLVAPNRERALQADGDALWLTVGLIESADGSNELAYICAYGLAQNVMRHSKKKGQNGLLGHALDLAAAVHGVNLGGLFSNMGQNAYKHGFTVEADLIALFLLASAGYDIDGYPVYWEQLLLGNSRQEFLTKLEQERIDTMYQVVAAIEAKKAAGEPLVPEGYLSGDTTIIE